MSEPGRAFIMAGAWIFHLCPINTQSLSGTGSNENRKFYPQNKKLLLPGNKIAMILIVVSFFGNKKTLTRTSMGKFLSDNLWRNSFENPHTLALISAYIPKINYLIFNINMRIISYF
jgi:hypothetical protein